MNNIRAKFNVFLLNIAGFLDRQSRTFFLISGILLVLLLGIIDHLTGYEYGFSLFYIIPIFFTVWFTGSFGIAMFMSLLSSITWIVADITSGHLYSHAVIPLWNTLLGFGFFYIFTILLLRLKHEYRREKELARIDPLTQTLNLRGFLEIAGREIERQKRYKRIKRLKIW